MEKFQMRPIIYEFDTVKEFVQEFSLSKEDLVFTHSFLYEGYMRKLNLLSDVIFFEDYGEGEPSDEIIDKILMSLSGKTYKRIIGIGGGTVLDIAKLLCIRDAKSTEDIFGEKIPLLRDTGLILIPTTCGTGCEMTCVSVVDLKKQNTKIGKRIEANFADSAVLIPELLDTLPDMPFLYSSVDALIHALEIYMAPTTNYFNNVYCAEAIRIILNRYNSLVEFGLSERKKYMKDFLRASCYAGIALANTACGAVHACAMHFGSKHHVPHGEANYRFLCAVFQKYVLLQPQGKIQEVAEFVKSSIPLRNSVNSENHVFEELQLFLENLIPFKGLRDYGMKEDDISSYAEKVFDSQQRLLINSYVSLTKENLIDIYQQIF